MFEVIKQSESTAPRRRIYFSLVDSADHVSPKDIVVTGVKVRLAKNGGGLANSTADIVKLDAATMPGEYYIELTAAECDTLGALNGYVQPTGCDAASMQATVVGYDPFSDGATVTDIATAVMAAASTTPIASDLKKVNGTTLGLHAGTALDPFGV